MLHSEEQQERILRYKMNVKKMLDARCWMLVFVFIIMISVNLYAQEMPHEGEESETGVITGSLLKDGKVPMPGHMVTLEILKGRQLVLKIPKPTDQNGKFTFKNIFQTPDFKYSVSTELEGKMYRTDFISLKKGESERSLNLVAGTGAKKGPGLPESIPDGGGQMQRGAQPHVHTKSINEYQLLAIILSLAAIAFAIFQWKKKR